MKISLGSCAAVALAAVLPAIALAGATKNYLSAFHTCPASSCMALSTHNTYLAESDDGATWTAIPGFSAVHWAGSVPDVIRRNNYLYVYNPGEVHKVRVGTGAIVSSGAVTITDSSGAAVNFVDPSPILDSVSGKIVLFYLVSDVSGDPAGCGGAASCTKHFRSATEVGSDGTTFLEDTGDRVSIAVTTSGDPVGPVASDPDIFADPSGFVLLVSRGRRIQVFTSTSLTGTYSSVSALTNSVLVEGESTTVAGLLGVSSGHYDTATSQYWIYTVDSPLSSSTPAVMRRAATSSLGVLLFNSNFTTVMNSSVVGLDNTVYSVASPGFTRNTP